VRLSTRLGKCLVIVVVVVVIVWHEELIFFQECGHLLADLGADAQPGDHSQKGLKRWVAAIQF
jgi:hypothetical protein